MNEVVRSTKRKGMMKLTQYTLTANGHSSNFSDASAAGTAYSLADAASQPEVRLDQLRFATTRLDGQNIDGTPRYIKELPASSLPGASAFRESYIAQLRLSLDGELAKVDWPAVTPKHAMHAPSLPEATWDRLQQYAREDFAGAVKLWASHCELRPGSFSVPTFLDPEYRRQVTEAKAISEALDTVRDSTTPPAQRVNAIRDIANAVLGRSIASESVRAQVAAAIAGEATARIKRQASSLAPPVPKAHGNGRGR